MHECDPAPADDAVFAAARIQTHVEHLHRGERAGGFFAALHLVRERVLLDFHNATVLGHPDGGAELAATSVGKRVGREGMESGGMERRRSNESTGRDCYRRC